jgi:transposase
MAGMSFAIALTDEQWELVADLFDPLGRRGAPAQIPRRQMVEAILFLARTGCQWRYLPERYGSWTAVWAQWRRWRANGVWARAMARLAAVVRLLHDREPIPSMVMVDAQTAKGGRYGPTFHEAGGRGGRTIGTKRTLLVEILGLPLAARADSARPHDVVAARELLRDRLPDLPSVRAIVGDRAYRGLARLAECKHLALDIKARPPGVSGFVPIRPLYRIEHAFAQLGRWRRLSRSGRYLMVGINRDARTELRVTDLTTGNAVALPKLENMKITIVMVTHDKDISASAGKVMYLKDGILSNQEAG